MYTIRRVKYQRQVHFAMIKPNMEKPIYTFNKFTVYRVIVYAQYTVPENKETVYLALNSDRSEEVIIYLTQHRFTHEISIRYWRSLSADEEIAHYLVMSFIQAYLRKISVVRKWLKKNG